MLADSVAEQLSEADVVSHMKQVLGASDVAVGLLHNSLTLVKSLSTIG